MLSRHILLKGLKPNTSTAARQTRFLATVSGSEGRIMPKFARKAGTPVANDRATLTIRVCN
jgi:hypothetical protein